MDKQRSLQLMIYRTISQGYTPIYQDNLTIVNSQSDQFNRTGTRSWQYDGHNCLCMRSILHVSRFEPNNLFEPLWILKIFELCFE